MAIRAYFHGHKDPSRNTAQQHVLMDFAEQNDWRVSAFYIEHEAFFSAPRPQLEALINDSDYGDILLVEDILTLARHDLKFWALIDDQLKAKNIEVFAINAPHINYKKKGVACDQLLADSYQDIRSGVISVLVSIENYNYQKRRRFQRQGIEIAKEKGLYKGRPKNISQYRTILKLLNRGKSYQQITEKLKVSSATISAAKRWSDQLQGH